MTSFGDLKNNLKRLQACDRQMAIITNVGENKSVFDQKYLKNHTIPFYLKVMHYLLVQYNSSFYKLVLDMIPNIKTIEDQKFVQSTINISRKLLNVNPKITAEQFLQPNKWIQKKLQFIVQICEGLLVWKNNNNNIKSTKTPKNQNESKPKTADRKVKNDWKEQDHEEDQEDELNHRQITVKPTIIQQKIDKKAFDINKNKYPTQVNTFKQNRETKVNMYKPNVFPKNIEREHLEEQEQQDDDDEKFINTAKFANKNGKISKMNNREVEEQSVEYVTRSQLNDVLEMISTMNGTFNQLVHKFNTFQSNVTSQITNTNARIILLEQNVRVIKSNL